MFISSPHNKRGFTLVEVLIAMAVLAVVFSAVTLMNYSSLGSFTSARDTTEATYIGQKTITILHAEAEQWATTATQTNWAGPADSVYQDGTVFGTAPILTSILTAGNAQWVDLNHAATPLASTARDLGTALGRFCVAARRIDLPATAAPGMAAIRVQIAVYYPGPAQPVVATCPDLLGAGGLPSISQGAYPGELLLRTKGTRVEFFSTIITPPVR